MEERLKFLIENNTTIQQCNALPEIEKWSIYFTYVARQYGLKHSVDIKLSDEKHHNNGLNFGPPDKIYLGLHFRYLWKDTPEPVSFNEFCSNITHVVIGENWKAQGYAAESWIDYPFDSIYYWLPRYKCKVQKAMPHSQVVLNRLPASNNYNPYAPTKPTRLDRLTLIVKRAYNKLLDFVVGEKQIIKISTGMYSFERKGISFSKINFNNQ